VVLFNSTTYLHTHMQTIIIIIIIITVHPVHLSLCTHTHTHTHTHIGGGKKAHKIQKTISEIINARWIVWCVL
jgi:hypothetical protein